MFAHEVLDSLLLRNGIEINKGQLANVPNMALFPIWKEEIRSHGIFLPLTGFCMDTGQGSSQRGVTGINAPGRLSRAPEDFLPTYAESPLRSEFSWYACET